MNKYKYIIIGNSAAAIGAVESIRAADKSGTIAIISDEKYHVYSRPMIGKRILNAATVESIAYRPADFYEKNAINAILGVKAASIDPKSHIVTLANDEAMVYEKLLIATGSTPSRPPIPGINLSKVWPFTTFDNADTIAKALPNIKNAVIIGGGLIGMELAEVLAKAGKKVTVVEMVDRILSPVLDEHTSALVENVFRNNGVEILKSVSVASIEGNKLNEADKVNLKNGTVLPCQAVIVAAGVKPRAELAADAGININRGIPVDDYMQTNAADIYAAGDVAEAKDMFSQKCCLTQIWSNAYLEGRAAGNVMAGKKILYSGSLSMNSSEFFGFKIMSAGIIRPTQKHTLIIDKNDKTDNYRKIILNGKTIVGMILAGEAVSIGTQILGHIRKQNDASEFLTKIRQ